MFKSPYLIGIDIGTTICKAVLFDSELKQVSAAEKEYPMPLCPKDGWSEQDPDIVLNGALTVIRKVVRNPQVDPATIKGICFSSQVLGLTPISKDGEPLRHAISWQDRRATSQAEWIRRKIGEEMIYDITGHKIGPINIEPMILWIKENQPDVYSRTYKFLCIKDYVEFRLTGEIATDPSCLVTSLSFDIRKAERSDELLDLMGIPSDKLPDIKPSISIAGYVTDTMSKPTRLRKDTPIIVGGFDTVVASLGAGIVRPGLILDASGTSTVISLHMDRRLLNRLMPKRQFYLSCHVIPNQYTCISVLVTTGAVLRWFRERLGGEEVRAAREQGVSVYSIMDREAEAVEPGSNKLILISQFEGARENASLRGVFFGLSLGHTRAHLIRAILEGVALSMRERLEALEEAGVPVKKIMLIGGGARSRIWNQIKADVMGIPMIRMDVDEAGPLGGAILAGTGVGIFKDVAKVAERRAAVREIFKPKPDVHAKYEKLYKIYTMVSNGLNQYFTTLYEAKI